MFAGYRIGAGDVFFVDYPPNVAAARSKGVQTITLGTDWAMIITGLDALLGCCSQRYIFYFPESPARVDHGLLPTDGQSCYTPQEYTPGGACLVFAQSQPG